jgi:hypothetical protein
MPRADGGQEMKDEKKGADAAAVATAEPVAGDAAPHAVYHFRTVEDMHAVPAEKIDHFCRDLALWLTMHKLVEAIDCAAIKVTSPRDVFGWIDDGKHDANITLKLHTDQIGNATQPLSEASGSVPSEAQK